MQNFLNPKRLRDYPRLFFFTASVILALNFGLHNGWLSATGKIIGNDFLVFYSAGALYRSQPNSIYDPTPLFEIEKSLIAPTPLEGLNNFSNPPYVAPLFSLLTYIQYPWAFAIWTLANIGCAVLAVVLLTQTITPAYLKQAGINARQLLIILGGYLGFIEGIEVGQSSGMLLLLVSACVVLTLRKRSVLAGLCAVGLLYKPHFTLAFLLVWLAWGDWRSLLSFALGAGAWVSASLAVQGIGPYMAYLNLLPRLLEFYEVPSLGSNLEFTLNGLLITLFGNANWQWISLLTQALAVAAGAALFLFAWRMRQGSQKSQAAVMIFVVLFPLIFAPHVLLHDSIILVIVFLLWSLVEQSKQLLYSVIAVYLVVFFLTPLTYQLKIAFFALIPIFLAGRVIWRLRNIPLQ